MGLTIHYELHFRGDQRSDARDLVERLQRSARDLPFAEVQDVVELSGDKVSAEPAVGDREHQWLLVQAGYFLHRGEVCTLVRPLEVIAFSTWPGPGCEAANFGLCRYPAQVTVREQDWATGLDGWHWQSFCKTQYASDPNAGGVENFLRCHLAVVQLLDAAGRLGILGEVNDDGGFWTNRDIAALAEQIGRWNRLVAGIAGQLKDEHSGDVIAPISDYPNFEHLEADGERRRPDDTRPR